MEPLPSYGAQAKLTEAPADLEYILRRVVWIRGALETTNPVLVVKALELLEDLESKLITDALLPPPSGGGLFRSTSALIQD